MVRLTFVKLHAFNAMFTLAFIGVSSCVYLRLTTNVNAETALTIRTRLKVAFDAMLSLFEESACSHICNESVFTTKASDNAFTVEHKHEDLTC
jgi:hypothetical protein